MSDNGRLRDAGTPAETETPTIDPVTGELKESGDEHVLYDGGRLSQCKGLNEKLPQVFAARTIAVMDAATLGKSIEVFRKIIFKLESERDMRASENTFDETALAGFIKGVGGDEKLQQLRRTVIGGADIPRRRVDIMRRITDTFRQSGKTEASNEQILEVLQILGLEHLFGEDRRSQFINMGSVLGGPGLDLDKHNSKLPNGRTVKIYTLV